MTFQELLISAPRKIYMCLYMRFLWGSWSSPPTDNRYWYYTIKMSIISSLLLYEANFLCCKYAIHLYCNIMQLVEHIGWACLACFCCWKGSFSIISNTISPGPLDKWNVDLHLVGRGIICCGHLFIIEIHNGWLRCCFINSFQVPYIWSWRRLCPSGWGREGLTLVNGGHEGLLDSLVPIRPIACPLWHESATGSGPIDGTLRWGEAR